MSANPLGSDKFDPVREVPAFQRQGFVRGAHDFKAPLLCHWRELRRLARADATEQ